MGRGNPTIRKNALVSTPPPSLWRNRAFLLLWSGQGISTLGSCISALALPLIVLALTHSPAQAGFVAAVRLLPNLILGLPAGALIDRWNRKNIMLCCDMARFLALGSIPLAIALGQLTVAQMYIVALVEGAAFSFFNIAEVAALPMVVPQTQLSRANALNQSADAMGNTVGPGLSGFIISLSQSVVIGGAFAFMADSISYLASVISLLFVHVPFQAERSQTERRSLYLEIGEGMDFLWKNHSLRIIAALGISLGFLYGPLNLAIIVLAQQSLHADTRTIGIIFSLSSVGGLAGSLIAPWITIHMRLGQTIIGAIAVRSVAMLLVAGALSPLMLIAGATLVSFLWPIYLVAQLSYRLSVIPDALQGRVNSNIRLLIFAAESLGTACGGLFVQALGPRPALWLIAVGMGLSATTVGITRLRHT